MKQGAGQVNRKVDNMWKYILKFGVAGLFTITRHLAGENEKLSAEVQELKEYISSLNTDYRNDLRDLLYRDQPDYNGYLQTKYNLDDDLYPNEEGEEKEEKDTRDFSKIKPFSVRRGASELMGEARRKYEERRALEDALRQEKIVEELTGGDEEPEIDATVKLSETKRNYYLERGQQIMSVRR